MEVLIHYDMIKELDNIGAFDLKANNRNGNSETDIRKYSKLILKKGVSEEIQTRYFRLLNAHEIAECFNTLLDVNSKKQIETLWAIVKKINEENIAKKEKAEKEYAGRYMYNVRYSKAPCNEYEAIGTSCNYSYFVVALPVELIEKFLDKGLYDIARQANNFNAKIGAPVLNEEKFTLAEVQKTGKIKKEDMEKLFSPFRRIEEKRNRSIEGTGLGMSIVRQLLSLMESELKVESVYGEGSTFSFEIKQKVVKREPMGDISSRLEKEATERKAYQELFHAPDASLLVVDDTEMNLKVIKHLLKKTGVKIDTVTTGKEALESARNNDYDVVFIDHMMPDMDGIETLHRMKEDFAGTPDRIEPVYIALTANAVSGAKEMYLAEGFMDYISKPVEGKILEEKLKTYLPDDKMRY